MENEVLVDMKEVVQKELDTIETKEEVLLCIRKMTRPETVDEGVTIKEGYKFDINSTVAELAFGIACLAKEMPNNDMGEGSDELFVTMIKEYLSRLKENEEA